MISTQVEAAVEMGGGGVAAVEMDGGEVAAVEMDGWGIAAVEMVRGGGMVEVMKRTKWL